MSDLEEKKAEMIGILDTYTEDDDPEGAHGMADEILCFFLREAGHEDLAEAFERCRRVVGFWYA